MQSCQCILRPNRENGWMQLLTSSPERLYCSDIEQKLRPGGSRPACHERLGGEPMNPTTRMAGRTQDFLRATLALLGALLLASPAWAQSPTGTILGHVKDTTGAVVPQATVTATHVATQYTRTTTTDADGQYALRLLPVGQYKVDITLTGFKSFSQTGILIEVGRNARVDATLEAGGIEEVVS